MSKIGKKPVVIPAGVEVQLNGNHIQVKGPKGTLEWDIPAAVTAKIEWTEIQFTIEKYVSKTFSKNAIIVIVWRYLHAVTIFKTTELRIFLKEEHYVG